MAYWGRFCSFKSKLKKSHKYYLFSFSLIDEAVTTQKHTKPLIGAQNRYMKLRCVCDFLTYMHIGIFCFAVTAVLILVSLLSQFLVAMT